VAVATDGTLALNAAIIHEFRIPEDVIDAAVEQERQEVERTGTCLPEWPFTGTDRGPLRHPWSTTGSPPGPGMLAAVRAVRPYTRKVMVAIPVAAQSTCNDFRHEVDHVICARIPWPFYSVGSFYRNFEQTTDAEVCSLLSKASALNEMVKS